MIICYVHCVERNIHPNASEKMNMQKFQSNSNYILQKSKIRSLLQNPTLSTLSLCQIVPGHRPSYMAHHPIGPILLEKLTDCGGCSHTAKRER